MIFTLTIVSKLKYFLQTIKSKIDKYNVLKTLIFTTVEFKKVEQKIFTAKTIKLNKGRSRIQNLFTGNRASGCCIHFRLSTINLWNRCVKMS